MRREGPGSPRGGEVIEEATRLLRGMRLSTDQGALAEGKRVAVSLDPRWNDASNTLRLLITCHAFGHRDTDWEGLPVFVSEEGLGGDSWIAFLDARGHAVIPSLPAGDLVVTASSCWGRSKAPGAGSSNDGRVQASVRTTESGDIAVILETADPSLARARVRFAFMQESGRVERGAEVLLEPVKERATSWAGHWVETIALSRPCWLVFEVVPAEG